MTRKIPADPVSNRLKALQWIDPSPRQRYIRWLDKISLSLENEPQKALARACLAEFHGTKHRMPVEERDINRYVSIGSLNETLVKYRESRFRPSRFYLSVLDVESVMERTLVIELDGLSILKPQSIEDVIVLTQNEEKFSSKKDGLFESLIEIGEVLVFVSGAGVHVGSKPKERGAKGMIFDCFGEPSVFEDILACHPSLRWSNAKEILSIMIQIDPCLPFDMGFENIEPYVVALEQFEFVLHEDREIPEHLIEPLREINPSWASSR